MTVWVVTLNTEIEGIAETRECAGQIIEAVMTAPKFMGEAWRPVGDDCWASRSVTSLKRQRYSVQP
jgi:hypothetical protein